MEIPPTGTYFILVLFLCLWVQTVVIYRTVGTQSVSHDHPAVARIIRTGEDGACYRNWPYSGITGPCHLYHLFSKDVEYGIVIHSSVKGSLYESTALGGRRMNLKTLEK